MNSLRKLPNNIAKGLIRVYRITLSPSVGVFRYIPFYPRPTCIFYPTCSEYAYTCFSKYPFFTALKKSVLRIGRCHPNNEPRVDLP